MINNLISILGPLIGAILITNFGYGLLYVIGSGLAFISMIPLLLSKEFTIKLDFNYKDLFKCLFDKKNANFNLSFVGFSIESQINYVLWPVFIFIILSGVFEVGLIVSLTTFFSVMIILIMGKLTDTKNKRNLIKVGTILTSISWFLRTFVNTKFKIFVVDTFKKFSSNILFIPWDAYNYDIARKRNYFEYFVARQLVFKGVRVIVFPFIILMFYLLPLKTTFILTFIIAGLFSLLYKKIKME